MFSSALKRQDNFQPADVASTVESSTVHETHRALFTGVGTLEECVEGFILIYELVIYLALNYEMTNRDLPSFIPGKISGVQHLLCAFCPHYTLHVSVLLSHLQRLSVVHVLMDPEGHGWLHCLPFTAFTFSLTQICTKK